jgi:hypothetical protein
MSTVRIARHWIDVGWRSLGIDRRNVAMLAGASVAAFLCLFGAGRVASPDSAPAEAGLAGLPSTRLELSVPNHLAAAAAIAPEAPVTVVVTHHRSQPTSTARGESIAPPTVTPTPVVSEPAPTPSVTSPRQAAPSKSTGGGGGSTSFDSSG